MNAEWLRFVTPDDRYGFSAWWHENEEYDDHRDHTFGEWYILRENVSLREALEFFLTQEARGRIYLRILSHEQYLALGDEADELLSACDNKHIYVLREECEKIFFDYTKKHSYHITEYTGYGSADDAATVILRSYNPYYSAEEQAEIDARRQKESRQQELSKGKELCKKHMLWSVRQVSGKIETAQKMLEKQIQQDPDIQTIQGSIQEKWKVFQKQRELRARIRDLETAREYLMHREELE